MAKATTKPVNRLAANIALGTAGFFIIASSVSFSAKSEDRNSAEQGQRNTGATLK